MSTPAELATVLAYDGLDPCPYLDGQTARLPLEYPLRPLSGRELDERLAAGFRRLGDLVYRAQCPSCQACEPIRILAREFRPNRSQRRTWRRGQATFTIEIGPCRVDAQKSHPMAQPICDETQPAARSGRCEGIKTVSTAPPAANSSSSLTVPSALWCRATTLLCRG